MQIPSQNVTLAQVELFFCHIPFIRPSEFIFWFFREEICKTPEIWWLKHSAMNSFFFFVSGIIGRNFVIAVWWTDLDEFGNIAEQIFPAELTIGNLRGVRNTEKFFLLFVISFLFRIIEVRNFFYGNSTKNHQHHSKNERYTSNGRNVSWIHCREKNSPKKVVPLNKYANVVSITCKCLGSC